jgi:hypothetical protein
LGFKNFGKWRRKLKYGELSRGVRNMLNDVQMNIEQRYILLFIYATDADVKYT